MDALVACVQSLARGSAAGCGSAAPAATPRPERLPCAALLTAYEACVEAHASTPPRPYDGEWCEEEKKAYRACRADTGRAPPARP